MIIRIMITYLSTLRTLWNSFDHCHLHRVLHYHFELFGFESSDSEQYEHGYQYLSCMIIHYRSLVHPKTPVYDDRYKGLSKFTDMPIANETEMSMHASHLAGRHLASIAPSSPMNFVVAPIPSHVFAISPNVPMNGATINPTVPLTTP